ncbi:MAG: hypothetical protein M9921_14805 [Fimbriimonadaceae bacterium]|nr:hypothetical protein [Chthonomonadaceae bacterium]MCO5298116.1 hypothetical protein [Fimbriimonadaceae bacterium]
MLDTVPVFAVRQGRGIVLSAADPAKDVRIVSGTTGSMDQLRDALSSKGLELLEGEWVAPGDPEQDAGGVYVVGVAYASGEGRPGLWMDATREAITPAQAVRAMYDEMRDNGEVAEVSFEDFVRAANPNVVVLSPYDVKHFLATKDD